MTEEMVVNGALTIRVFLIGGILLILPRIVRKGLVFGAYVGEAVSDGDAARNIRRDWNQGCLVVMALSLVVGLGISFAGWPLTGNLTGTAVLILSATLLYIRMYLKSRELAPRSVARQAEVASASLAVTSPRNVAFATFSLVTCLLAGLATIVYVAVSYEAIPEQMVSYANILGITDELTEKSIFAVMYAPILSLVLSSSFALLSVLITGSKRSLRGGSGSHSVAAQEAYHAIQVQVFSVFALFFCVVLTTFAVQHIRIARSLTESLGTGTGWDFAAILAAMIAFIAITLVRILRGTGQGGALLEKGSIETPLTGGLADNSHWFLGLFYVDKYDPSMMVESRFGMGYSMNFGNWRAMLFLGTFLVLITVLLALPFMGIVT
tara:strand:- start:9135 stop:10274 length:1140 start_codon:yes stop_codon:yes gene_type:complete